MRFESTALSRTEIARYSEPTIRKTISCSASWPAAAQQGVPIPTVAKRLGHAKANITLSIYAHALEADEVAAAKIRDDAMVDVIGAGKHQPKRMLANVSAEGHEKLEVSEKAG